MTWKTGDGMGNANNLVRCNCAYRKKGGGKANMLRDISTIFYKLFLKIFWPYYSALTQNAAVVREEDGRTLFCSLW